MANSEEIEAKLCSFIEGDLDPAERAEMQTTLKPTSSSAGWLRILGQTKSLLRGLPRTKAPPTLLIAWCEDRAIDAAGGRIVPRARSRNRWPHWRRWRRCLCRGRPRKSDLVWPRSATSGGAARWFSRWVCISGAFSGIEVSLDERAKLGFNFFAVGHDYSITNLKF